MLLKCSVDLDDGGERKCVFVVLKSLKSPNKTAPSAKLTFLA